MNIAKPLYLSPENHELFQHQIFVYILKHILVALRNTRTCILLNKLMIFNKNSEVFLSSFEVCDHISTTACCLAF